MIKYRKNVISKSKYLHIRVTPSEHAYIEAQAKKAGISMSELVYSCIVKKLGK